MDEQDQKQASPSEAYYETSAERARKAAAYRDDAMDPKMVVGVLAVALLIAALSVRGISSAISSRRAEKEQQSEEALTTVLAFGNGPAITVDLVMAGDVNANWSVFSSGIAEDGSRSYPHLFEHIKDEVSQADVALVSQATPLGGERFEWSEEPKYNAPQEIGDAEVDAGFDVILKASDHSLDQGQEGLSEELRFWERSHAGIAVLGARLPENNPASATEPYIYEKEGMKIAIFNYSSSAGTDDEEGLIAVLNEDQIRKDIIAVKSSVDMIVVCPHWGNENATQPNKEQRSYAKLFSELGVDVVLGTGPLVLQPIEVFTNEEGKQMVCFWSLGCVIQGLYTNANMVGGLAKVQLEKNANGYSRIVSYGMIPTITHVAQGADEGSYLLSSYTDELASTSRFPGVTPIWAKDYCTLVLGDAFNYETGTVYVEMQEVRLP